MANTNNVFELNGTYYDAASGAIVSKEKVTPNHVATMRKVEVVKHPAGNHAIKSVDGMAPRAAKPLTPHKPHRSNTLMRHAVKNPAALTPAPKAAVTAHGSLDSITVRRTPAIALKHSITQVHPQRALRAQTITRSDVVSRYAKPRPVVAAAAPVAPVAAAHAPAHVPAHAPAPVKAFAVRRPEAVTNQTDDDIFSQALAAAADHQSGSPIEPRHHRKAGKKRSHGKKFAVAGLAVAVLAAVGAFVYLNKPILEMRMASMRSGISATLPHYTPTGFDVSQMKYSAGAVKVAFNGPGGQNFSIDQKKSNWDSDTLMDNFVASTDKSYNAYQANGRTVFIYGEGNATWVNGGIWYQLTSNGLTEDEMLKVASTM